ncbi:glycosyltransferase [Nostoc sp. FACHB-110]|uniref:glycosyltransferase n=1 Tax=Nostoc sp. FACHB-110 TaxID=2692834 RepID=UPI001685F9A6|nr:glycosyltransferase [Nostoc sp. FACHB-110]MBD2437140.1 glycosyltransferase [Nostoc sp. FACHB-110]
MKILHVIPSVASVRGGPSQAVQEIVKELLTLDVDVEIVTTNDNGNNLLDVPLAQLIKYNDVPVRFFNRFSPKVNAIREFAFSSQLTTWLWQNIDKYELLHVHAIFSYPSTIAMAIARFKNVPYIVRPLGQLCKWSLEQSTRKKQVYLNLIERSNLQYSQAVHFTSELEQQEAERLNLGVSGFVLPHGLSIPPTISDARLRLRQHLNLPIDQPIILFLSRLHPKKGLEYLISALCKLQNYRFTLVIAGSGSPEYTEQLKSLVVSTGISDRTHFAGFIENETKDLYLQGADLFALTSHSENFGIAVLEALAAGVPVLITPCVALASVVEKYQLGYVLPQDILKISDTIEKFLNHPQLSQEMGDRARQVVLDQYTWKNIACQMVDIYTKIIKKAHFLD